MKNSRVVSEMMSFLADHGYSWFELFLMTKDQVLSAYNKMIVCLREEEIC